MNVFEFVLGIVFMGMIFSLIRAGMGHKHERSQASKSQETADEFRDLIDKLEERIQVLERIVTDGSGREELRRRFRDLER